MEIIINIIQSVLYIYITTTVLILLIFAAASRVPYKPLLPKISRQRKFAVMIPAYCEDEVIIEVVVDALKQDYPEELFKVVVVADHFKDETIDKLRLTKAMILPKNFSISTKSRALNYGLDNIGDDFDVLCILDADNLMEKDFLSKMNHAFEAGNIAVQGHRIAKNTNTNFAVLDAISEEVNNNIFRLGQRVLGQSSTLIGSAMAFDFQLFKKMISEVEVVGGFDKEIEMRLFAAGHRIEYLPDAIVYDEKVQNAAVFTKQRRRWLSAQFHFFGKNLIPSIKALFREGNFEYFSKALQYLQLPRILLIGFVFLAAVLSTILRSEQWATLWWIDMALIIFVFLLAIPGKFYNFRTLAALTALPLGFLSMLVSLVRMNKANKHFIHTKHTYNAFQIKKKNR